MKAPGFWSRPPGLLSAVLAPLGALYARATARRVARGGTRLGVPVICVGNLTAGGTGKTPTAMWLAGRIDGAHVVSRGHGGRLEGPVRVDPARHGADEVGDEALLLSAFAPVWVAKDRAAGGRAAEAAGARAVILDDGFQNPALEKDLSIIVVDAGAGFGNNRVIPAGPLREPVAAGMARADLVMVVGEGDVGLPDGPAVLRGRLAPLRTGMDWKGLPVFAFAGIGRPEKFFATLRGLGCDIRGTEALADHQPLTPALLRRLGDRAARLSAQPVTTEKDAVRLPPALRGQVMVVPVRLEIADPAPLEAALSGLGLLPTETGARGRPSRSL